MPTSSASRRGTKPAAASGTTEEKAIEEELRKWEKKMGPKVLGVISKKNVGAQIDYERLLYELKEEKRLRESNVEHYTSLCGAESTNYNVIGDDETQIIPYQTLIGSNKRMLDTISDAIDILEKGSGDDLVRLKKNWEALARDPPTPPKTGSNHFKALKGRATKVLGTLSCSRSK